MWDSDLVQIDGSYGEGGGQIIRTCLSLSAITGRPFRMENIRAGRTRPGLQPQHFAAVRATASLCSAVTDGERVGSTTLLFQPQDSVQPGIYRFDIGTAGSAALVAQTVTLPLALLPEPSEVRVTGGTHVPHAPSVDYLRQVYQPALQRIGVTVFHESDTSGYFPRGGGSLSVKVPGGAQPQAIEWISRDKDLDLAAHIVTSNLPGHVAERGACAATRYFKTIGREIQPVIAERPSIGTGAGVLIAARTHYGWAGFSALGERGKPMEAVAQEACAGFLPWWKSGACCDERLADQIVLPLALADAVSRFTTPRLTNHLKTVLWAARHFLPIEYDWCEVYNGPLTIRLKGAAILA